MGETADYKALHQRAHILATSPICRNHGEPINRQLVALKQKILAVSNDSFLAKLKTSIKKTL